MNNTIKTQIVVLGAGPAGYSAAFRCADLGLDTVIVERYDSLGGVCLNVGCIPSKALLHIAKFIEESKILNEYGIILNDQKFDINNIRFWKTKIVNQLTNGLASMAKSRKIKIIKGLGKFIETNFLEVKDIKNNKITINFKYAIIATGSRPAKLPIAPYSDLRIWNSTNALELNEIPNRILIVGGGIIGLEMGTVYHALGSTIDLVEIFNQIIPSADEDIIEIFTKNIRKKINLMLETKITAIESKMDGIHVSMVDRDMSTKYQIYDAVLITIGRIPNSENINIDKIGIEVNEFGFICVDKQLRTNIPNIFAIGDVVGQPMLAHKGMHEGHIAAEVIAGMNHYFDPKVIPSIAYTEPEIAWVGLSEREAKEKGINFRTAVFPWTASGRAIASNYNDGITKLIFDKETHRIIGGAIVGNNGGELLGEISLAIEMGCYAEDIALTIHAHPTMYESIGMAAKVFEGSITDLLNPKVNRR